MNVKIFIYGLREVGTVEIRYVGQSNNPHSRCKLHVKDLERSALPTNPKRLWIEDVLGRGSGIEYVILDECSSCDEAVVRENFWIDHYSGTGHRLTNTDRAIKSIIESAAKRKEKERQWMIEYRSRRASGERKNYDFDAL